jgi:hypothetical protein
MDVENIVQSLVEHGKFDMAKSVLGREIDSVEKRIKKIAERYSDNGENIPLSRMVELDMLKFRQGGYFSALGRIFEIEGNSENRLRCVYKSAELSIPDYQILSQPQPDSL